MIPHTHISREGARDVSCTLSRHRICVHSATVNVFIDDSHLQECMHQRTREMRLGKQADVAKFCLRKSDMIHILECISSPGRELPGASNEQNLGIGTRFSANSMAEVRPRPSQLNQLAYFV